MESKSQKEIAMIITPEVYYLIYKMYRLSHYSSPPNPEIEFPPDISFAEKAAIKAAVLSMQTILNVAKETGV
jgi:hypothetical protein